MRALTPTIFYNLKGLDWYTKTQTWDDDLLYIRPWCLDDGMNGPIRLNHGDRRLKPLLPTVISSN